MTAPVKERNRAPETKKTDKGFIVLIEDIYFNNRLELTAQHRFDYADVTITNDWAGCSETGFGAETSMSLSREDARALIETLQQWLNNPTPDCKPASRRAQAERTMTELERKKAAIRYEPELLQDGPAMKALGMEARRRGERYDSYPAVLNDNKVALEHWMDGWYSEHDEQMRLRADGVPPLLRLGKLPVWLKFTPEHRAHMNTQPLTLKLREH